MLTSFRQLMNFSSKNDITILTYIPKSNQRILIKENLYASFILSTMISKNSATYLTAEKTAITANAKGQSEPLVVRGSESEGRGGINL